MVFENTTTNRSDFTWPYLAEKQKIFDWDRYEYKDRPCENAKPPDSSGLPQQSKQSLCDAETLPMTHSQKFRFDFDFRPKPILGPEQSVSRYPTEKLIQYDKDKEDAKISTVRTRPRVFLCPQISLDDVSADKRDMMLATIYSSSKTISELTSGVPPGSPVSADNNVLPSKPFTAADPMLFKCGDRRHPLYKTINPDKNWRRVSIEWDKSQKRIFGGRSVD